MKYVVVYLVLPRLPSLQRFPLEPSTRIFRGNGGLEATDEVQLRNISEHIYRICKDGHDTKGGNLRLDLQRYADLSTDDLQEIFSPYWLQQEVYDIVNPFGDDREVDVETLWILDFENDIIQHANAEGRRSLRLSTLLERRGQVSLADFQPAGPAVPPYTPPSIAAVYPDNKPYWRPNIHLHPRTQAVAHRILRDFDFQWRHVLRAEYNDITRRRLARAILLLSTLRFEVREVTEERHGVRGAFVPIRTMPAWDPLKENIVRMGNIHVLVCGSLQEGYSIAQQHAQGCGAHPSVAGTEQRNNGDQDELRYMLLSVKAIALCRINDTNGLDCTAPEPLLNGNSETGAPSNLALDFLLWATAAARLTVRTPIQGLPIELQDYVLDYVSAGSVAAAHVGCILGIGSPFRWNFAPELPLELGDYYRNRHLHSPVESQVWFSDHMSGVVYIKGYIDKCE